MFLALSGLLLIGVQRARLIVRMTRMLLVAPACEYSTGKAAVVLMLLFLLVAPVDIKVATVDVVVVG